MCVCVCVFMGSFVLKIFVERWFWELKTLIGSLVELHAWLHSYLCFSLLEKWFLSNLDTSSIPSRHLAICWALKVFSYCNLDRSSIAGGLNDKVPRPSIAFWQLVDWSSFSSCVFALFLDTFSTVVSVEVVFLNTFLDRWLDTSICRELLRTYIYSFFAIRFSFLRSLSTCPHLFISQTLSLSLQTSSPVIFQAFSSFPSLGKLLISFIYMHSCFET